MTVAELMAEPSRNVALVIIVVMDWCMLGVGLVYEMSASTDRVITLGAWACGARPSAQLFLTLGFVPFVGAFVPILIVLSGNGSPEGIASFVLTFVSWALYGIVALTLRAPDARNTAYNLLDILSKNVVGIVIAIVALRANDTVSCIV